MKKQYCTANKRSMVKMGAAVSLIVCLGLQAVGCSPTGNVKEPDLETTIAAAQAGTSKTEPTTADSQSATSKEEASAADASGAGQFRSGSEGAELGETESEGTQNEGEGDNGIEAQPGMPLKAGNKAPDFTAELIDGSAISLSDFKGKPVIINFWATWCGPCVREMPAFERLKEDFGDEIGIIAVNVGEDTDTVKDFASENGYTFPIALDGEYEISMLYPTNSIPYTVVIDANGKVTHVSAGAMDADTMYERYKEALGV